MIRSYQMHEEQIASIAQTMKDLYQVRRIHSPSERSRDTAGAAARPQCRDATTTGTNSRLAATTMAKVGGHPEQFMYPGPASANAPAQRYIPSIRCIRCGDDFPVMDFLYTKKSGLCISCWEIKIGVAKCQ